MRARLIALLATALLAAGGAALAPAQAAPSDQGVASRSTTASERQATLRYWTSARMASAVERVARPSAQAKPGSGSGITGTIGSGTSSNTTDVLKSGSPSPQTAVGKVFFTLKATNYVCSASVVSSANDSTVLTAGHCLHEGRGGNRGFASNFMFVPAYDGSVSPAKEPYGRYAASRLLTTSGWANSGDFVHDVGFAVVARPTTGGVEVRTGGFGLDFSPNSAGTATTSWGYPAAGIYNGQTLTSCAGETVRDPYGSNTQGIPCNLTGGSSGGPWLVDASGLAHSVNSYKYTNGPYANANMYGPYFGPAARSLYETAQK